ncbi:S-adenosyl-L-methionine-dependent methyltransferase [Thelephora ganbajun]|uniref:S-adenosyl-L-methionine-dependent methyltransferase n=1 Tax=Thelephora ganbajun TaxID=370292 RepID=A0ACB6ZDL5_THEGA|nr:S-adenosyl-L-methionine-dependent methyltransferase [Thelephora ganbajun]
MENTTKKAMSIRKSRELSEQLENVVLENGGTTLHSAKYHLLPADLRTPPTESVASLLISTSPPSSHREGPILSPDLPTLLLFECVLVYVAPEASRAFIQWFVDYFASSSVLGAVVYEMFGLNDPFGAVMVENLKVRGVSLPGAEPYPTFESLPQRFTRHKFTTSKALTLHEIRKTLISSEEMQRISSLEMLDEIEELDLVLAHYAVTWGVKLPSDQQLSPASKWIEWGLKAPACSDHPDSDSD